MKIKRYLEFITEEFVSKDTKVNWGEAEFEVKEMFRIFNDLRDELPNEFIIGGDKFILDKSIFGTKGKSMEFEPKDFERQVEDINMKHTDPSKEEGTTSEDLLRKTTYTLNNGEKVDAKPYYDFIKLCRKLFWTGTKIQLDESGVKKLADDSQTIGRGDFAKFLKDAGEYQRLKKDFPDIDKQAYSEACSFLSYYGGSFDFFDKNIENGGEMPITSAIEIGGKWYIVGGNRRMTYYVLSGINPKIWLIKL